MLALTLVVQPNQIHTGIWRSVGEFYFGPMASFRMDGVPKSALGSIIFE